MYTFKIQCVDSISNLNLRASVKVHIRFGWMNLGCIQHYKDNEYQIFLFFLKVINTSLTGCNLFIHKINI